MQCWQLIFSPVNCFLFSLLFFFSFFFFWLYLVPDLNVCSCHLWSSSSAAQWQSSNSLQRWVWGCVCVQGNIYGFVSCWHYRKGLKTARGVLAAADCSSGWVREPRGSLLGLSECIAFPRNKNSRFSNSLGSKVTLDDKHLLFTSECPLATHSAVLSTGGVDGEGLMHFFPPCSDSVT